MRPVWNHLGDPSLHLLAIALLAIYLTFGRGPSHREDAGEAPLPYCDGCHVHYLPDNPCECRTTRDIAHALP